MLSQVKSSCLSHLLDFSLSFESLSCHLLVSSSCHIVLYCITLLVKLYKKVVEVVSIDFCNGSDSNSGLQTVKMFGLTA